MGVATLVGGTIVIPHLRRAFEYWRNFKMFKRDLEQEKSWASLLTALRKTHWQKTKRFKCCTFLIGVQETGQGRKVFEKEEKQDLMHIGICKVLSLSGYYELEGLDKDGWPHWKLVKKTTPF